MYCLPRVAQRPTRAASGLPERLGQQRVRLRCRPCPARGSTPCRSTPGRRSNRDELGDLDHVGADLLQRLELFRREDDVLVLRELVALHHVLARHDHALLRADVLLLEARAARRLVQQVEGDRAGGLRRGIELHRDRHEAERDRQRCDRSCSHDATFLLLCAPAEPALCRGTVPGPAPGSACPGGHSASDRPSFPSVTAHLLAGNQGDGPSPAPPRSAAWTPGPRAPPGGNRRRSGSSRGRSCCSR